MFFIFAFLYFWPFEAIKWYKRVELFVDPGGLKVPSLCLIVYMFFPPYLVLGQNGVNYSYENGVVGDVSPVLEKLGLS